MDMLGDAQPLTGVPASAIQDEHKLLGGTGSHLAGKLRQLDLKE
jgi:hypothetical protein